MCKLMAGSPSGSGPRHTGGMTGFRRYRLPDGVEVESDQGSEVTFRVTMPADDAGHIGRQCPSCEQLFRMHAADYMALPDDQRITCPYCGFSADHSEFITPQQVERARAAAGEWAQQLVADKIGTALDDMVRSINRSSSDGGMISFSASRRPTMASTTTTRCTTPSASATKTSSSCSRRS